jgi:sulfite exporter TauE/SafE
MTRGLVRKNNLSDLPDPVLARQNLGLSAADYNRIRGLYASAGVISTDIQRIANANGNYQAQIDGLNSTLSGIIPSLYVSRSGDTITSGWTNVGYIQPASVIQSGVTLSGSSDALFTLAVSGSSFALSTTTLVMQSGVTVQQLSSSGNTTVASGTIPVRLIPIKIGGVSYFLEAS